MIEALRSNGRVARADIVEQRAGRAARAREVAHLCHTSCRVMSCHAMTRRVTACVPLHAPRGRARTPRMHVVSTAFANGISAHALGAS